MTGNLRAGVIGLGRMGRHHARVLRTLPGVEFVAAVDARADVRQASAATGVDALESVSDLVRRGIDLCVVSTPTATHEEVALELAAAGVATLIEKPVAHNSKSAQTILEALDRSGVVGCVGQIELYNPALQQMRIRLDRGELGELYQVVTRRQGPFPARITDAGVIMDLASHDIDLTSWVTRASYRSIAARTAHRSGREHEDLVSTVAELSNGVVATHLVNWLSPLKERITTVTGERGCFTADTVTADLTFYKNGSEPVQWDRVASFRGVSEGDMIRYAIPKPEPLWTELSNFVAAVRGEPAEVVSLEEGLLTVRVAEMMRESARAGRTIEVVL
jgi:UDP-N-acetylglucosamine 3-dehydrogenase